MVDKLAELVAPATHAEQLAIEKGFLAWLPADPDPDVPRVDLKGRVDRLERDEQGRLVVVDLKTGAGAPSATPTRLEHPQLGRLPGR